MQDKVHFTPPEVKIFQDKAPPTSWFNENVVRYFHIKSDMGFLQDILSYAKGLQKESLKKTLPQPVEADALIYEAPEGADAKQLSQASTFNALGPNIKKEVELVEKLITVVQKQDPAFAKELDQDLTLVKQIARSFPKLSEEQLSKLAEMMKNLEKYLPKMTQSGRKTFYEEQFKILGTMTADMEESQANTNEELKDAEKKLQILQKLQGKLGKFNEILQKAGKTPLKPNDVEELLAFVQLISDAHSAIPGKQKTDVEKFFNQLGQIKAGKNVSFPGALSGPVIRKWLGQFLKAEPNASLSQAREQLRILLSESNLSSSPLPFFQELGKSIEENLKEENFPKSTENTGIEFASEKNGKISINEEYDEQFSKNLQLDPAGISAAVNSIPQFKESIASAQINLEARREGFQASATAQEEAKTSIGNAAAGAVGNAYGSGSLPNDFKNAILGHYMPGQQKYLMMLAELLNFDNFGASMGNAILNKILDFGEAASNYNFNNFLHGSGGEFSGNPSTAKSQLSAELNQANTDLRKLEDAIKYMKQEIKKIQDNKSLSQTQKNKLIKKLHGYINNMDSAETQEKSLIKLLSNMKVVPDPKDPTGKFTIESNSNTPLPKDWQSQLGKDEKAVINGDPKAKYPGGLVSIQAMVQADQQQFADLSQQQTMILQMRMTEIQQEWTVVSTALQSLNQMYTQLAQAIYH